MVKGKVEFSINEGPVTLEIASGYVTLGTFILSYAKRGETDLTEFGDNPKRIDDAKKDIYQLPFPASELKNYILIINGKYGPSPGHTQVKVNYSFKQNEKELKVSPQSSAEIEDTPDEPYKRYSHFFDFTEKA